MSIWVGVDVCLLDLLSFTWNFSSLPMDGGKDGVLSSLLFLLLQSLSCPFICALRGLLAE